MSSQWKNERILRVDATQCPYSSAFNRHLKALRLGTCMAARCNCLRRCTSSMAPMRAANGSDAASAKRISSTSSKSSMARSRPPCLMPSSRAFSARVLGKRGFADEVHEMLLGNSGHDCLRIIHQPAQDRQSREKVGLVRPIQRQGGRPGDTLL